MLRLSTSFTAYIHKVYNVGFEKNMSDFSRAMTAISKRHRGDKMFTKDNSSLKKMTGFRHVLLK